MLHARSNRVTFALCDDSARLCTGARTLGEWARRTSEHEFLQKYFLGEGYTCIGEGVIKTIDTIPSNTVIATASCLHAKGDD